VLVDDNFCGRPDKFDPMIKINVDKADSSDLKAKKTKKCLHRDVDDDDLVEFWGVGGW
jgi:hypothetical protein